MLSGDAFHEEIPTITVGRKNQCCLKHQDTQNGLLSRKLQWSKYCLFCSILANMIYNDLSLSLTWQCLGSKYPFHSKQSYSTHGFIMLQLIPVKLPPRLPLLYLTTKLLWSQKFILQMLYLSCLSIIALEEKS